MALRLLKFKRGINHRQNFQEIFRKFSGNQIELNRIKVWERKRKAEIILEKRLN